MRTVKPETLIIQNAATQIGQQAFLGISVGVGFRLDDPRIILNELSVWDALQKAPLSVALNELAMPKRHAEWLLAGHTKSQLPADRREQAIEWTCSAELAGVQKRLNCRMPLSALEYEQGFAKLAINHRHAAQGDNQQNPLGIESNQPVLLQRIEGNQQFPYPMSSMEAIDVTWSERHQWMPVFAETVEDIANNGSHMGWPDYLDLRYLQQAAPDQWFNDAVWPTGAAYCLQGFGADGQGFSNQLPSLQVQMLIRKHGSADLLPLALAQQSVWFLPDQGIGVMWWHGKAERDNPLDDNLDIVVAALKDCHQAMDIDVINELIVKRFNDDAIDFDSIANLKLLPDMSSGWTWELIKDVYDRPRDLPPLSYAELRERVEQQILELDQTKAEYEKLSADPLVPQLPTLQQPSTSDGQWRQTFITTEPQLIENITIRGEDLSGLHLKDWQFKQVRFEQCQLERSHWQACQFEDVTVNDCSLIDSQWVDLTWAKGAINRSNLERSFWDNCNWSDLHIEACTLTAFGACGGQWENIVVQDSHGNDGYCENLQWKHVTFIQINAIDWRWQSLNTDDLTVADSQLIGIKLTGCFLNKASFTGSDLSESSWQSCRTQGLVMALNTRLVAATFDNCLLSTSSMIKVIADQITMRFCSLTEFNAQGIQASGSDWFKSVLNGAQLMQANFSHAVFESSSLKESLLYNADFRNSRVHNCNLIKVQSSWIHQPNSADWHGNLESGRVDLPRRQA